jgi:SAM-dependent methyltransferase
MTSVQERAHPEGFDYTVGSPHLKHPRLRSRVEACLNEEVRRIHHRRGVCRALEVGAGHGSFTRTLRNAGADVIVTEMSGPSADYLSKAFARDPSVHVVHDADGSWTMATADLFDLVVCISVLHHIPDYLRAVSRYAAMTKPGGSFVSWQDPLWYSRLPTSSLLFSRIAYLGWRVGQGNLSRGIATRIRRLRGIYDETRLEDMSEYHVVRQGVDEESLTSLLVKNYREASTSRYWSTQASAFQRVGEVLGVANTFSLLARNRAAEEAR